MPKLQTQEADHLKKGVIPAADPHMDGDRDLAREPDRAWDPVPEKAHSGRWAVPDLTIGCCLVFREWHDPREGKAPWCSDCPWIMRAGCCMWKLFPARDTDLMKKPFAPFKNPRFPLPCVMVSQSAVWRFYPCSFNWSEMS